MAPPHVVPLAGCWAPPQSAKTLGVTTLRSHDARDCCEFTVVVGVCVTARLAGRPAGRLSTVCVRASATAGVSGWATAPPAHTLVFWPTQKNTNSWQLCGRAARGESLWVLHTRQADAHCVSHTRCPGTHCKSQNTTVTTMSHAGLGVGSCTAASMTPPGRRLSRDRVFQRQGIPRGPGKPKGTQLK